MVGWYPAWRNSRARDTSALEGKLPLVSWFGLLIGWVDGWVGCWLVSGWVSGRLSGWWVCVVFVGSWVDGWLVDCRLAGRLIE